MSEIVTREIIGLAQKSKWKKILEVIKTLVKKTLKKKAGYTLVALDAQINKEFKEEFSYIIHSVNDITKLDEISSFNMLSLYQYTDTSSDHISISQQDGILIMIAKYMGPAMPHHDYFDFMVHLDPINDPYFTYGRGQILSCADMLEIINKNRNIPEIAPPPVKVKGAQKTPKTKLKRQKAPESQPIEAQVYEKLKGKNAEWGGSETKLFLAWKKRTAQEFAQDTGKGAYYKGKPTKNYITYLDQLLNPKTKQKMASKTPSKKKSSPKKPVAKKKRGPKKSTTTKKSAPRKKPTSIKRKAAR